MPVTLTIKALPDKLAAKLRLLAEVNRRSLEDELMAIIRSAATSKRSVGAGRRLTLKEAWERSAESWTHRRPPNLRRSSARCGMSVTVIDA